MRSSNETYVKVAEACSAYKPSTSAKAMNSAAGATNKATNSAASSKAMNSAAGATNKATNNAASAARSCTTCSHFDHNGAYCDIDLYDKIVKEHGFTR